MFGIITDSVACLSEEDQHRWQIEVVPIHVYLDEVEVAPDADPGTVYQQLAGPARVTTSTPSPGEYLSAMNRVAARGGEGALVLAVSGALSTVLDSAQVAARQASIPVVVVDTRLAASAQGLLAVRMAELTADAETLDELATAAVQLRSRYRLMAVLPGLSRLSETGRIPRAAAYVGGRLGIMPLLTLRPDGEIHPTGVVRDIDRGIDRMVVEAANDRTRRAVVMHAAAGSRAATLRDRLADAAPDAGVTVADFPLVIGASTGPGLVGLAWEAA